MKFWNGFLGLIWVLQRASWGKRNFYTHQYGHLRLLELKSASVSPKEQKKHCKCVFVEETKYGIQLLRTLLNPRQELEVFSPNPSLYHHIETATASSVTWTSFSSFMFCI